MSESPAPAVNNFLSIPAIIAGYFTATALSFAKLINNFASLCRAAPWSPSVADGGACPERGYFHRGKMTQNIKNTEKKPKWLRELEAKWDAEDAAEDAAWEAEHKKRMDELAALKNVAAGAGQIKATQDLLALAENHKAQQTKENLKAQIAKCDEQIRENSKRYTDDHPERAAGIFADHQAIVQRKEALTKELNRMETEARIKAEHKAKFLANSGFGKPEDFDRLWETKLRDEVLLDLATGKKEPVDYAVFGGWDSSPQVSHKAAAPGLDLTLKRREIAPKPAHLRK